MNNAFMNALGVIINALADQAGIKIRMNAARFSTDGDTVCLPTSDNRKLLLGGGAHEGGHCKHSDFSILKQIETPLEKHVNNILEDIYIEKSMINDYPGVRLMLADMVHELIELKMFSEPSEISTPMEMIQTFMLYRLRADVLEQKAIEAFADKAESLVRAALPAGMMIRLESLMFQVDECKSSQDVLDLTRAIITMMEDEAKKEEEKEQQQDDQSQSPDADDLDQDGDSGQSDTSDQDGGSGAPDASDDSDQATGSEQSSDGKSDDSGADQQSVEDQSNGQKASDIIKAILAADDADAIKSTGEALEEAFGESQVYSAEAINSNVAPFKNHGFPHKHVPMTDIDAEKNRVAGVSNAMRVRAQSLLQAQTMSSKRNVLVGTKLNVKNLHQARLGGPIFQKESRGVAIDTAILLLVDRSTSMEYRIGLATDAALATTMAFQRPDVKTAVFTFPYTQGEEGNGVLKHWNAQPASAVPAYQSLGVDGCTPMAEAMMGAGLALMQRPEKRKILLVATDGEPDNRGAAQWVINLARKSGIEVLGLGILCDTSGVFGSQWSGKIDSIDNLPLAMIGMLDNVMLKKAA